MNINFAARVIGTLAVLAIAYAVSAGLTWLSLEKMADQTRSTITQDIKQLDDVGQLRYLMLQVRRAEKDISIDLQMRPENTKKRAETWLGLVAQMTAQAKQVVLTSDPDHLEKAKTMQGLLEQYTEGGKGFVTQVAQGRLSSIEAFEKGFDAPKKTIRSAEDISSKIITAVSAKAESEYQLIGAALLQARWVLAAGTTVFVGLSIVLGVILVRRLRRPLAAMAAVMQAVGQGDLRIRANTAGKDEISLMALAFNAMLDRLRDTVAKVDTASRNVSRTSDAVAVGNQDLSQRTEQGASSLQETAAAMEQLSGTVAQSADTASNASVVAARAAKAAQAGGDVVQQAINGMQRIRAASQRIADITGIIDGIAFQTNILALNAAVEAARAGEQGRGFAVVAAEVRSLAGRSGSAAREINSLIAESIAEVEGGTRSVNQAGNVMRDLVVQVQEVHHLMNEISNAAEQQRDGIGQVNQAVGLLDQMMQSNAALVEQSAAAADTLKTDGRDLVAAVAFFKTNQSP
jgi:methyl-accepting chemotaxis protein